MANFFWGPTQIDQLVPLVLTGFAKNYWGPTPYDQLVPWVLTGLAKKKWGPTPFPDKNSQKMTHPLLFPTIIHNK